MHQPPEQPPLPQLPPPSAAARVRSYFQWPVGRARGRGRGPKRRRVGPLFGLGQGGTALDISTGYQRRDDSRYVWRLTWPAPSKWPSNENLRKAHDRFKTLSHSSNVQAQGVPRLRWRPPRPAAAVDGQYAVQPFLRGLLPPSLVPRAQFASFFVSSCLLRSCRVRNLLLSLCPPASFARAVRNSLLSLCPPASFARATCALRLFLAFLTLSLRFLACHHDLNPHRLSRLSGSPLLEHGS